MLVALSGGMDGVFSWDGVSWAKIGGPASWFVASWALCVREPVSP
ncbi:hypothetical protein [Kitasatospora purpeofusca]